MGGRTAPFGPCTGPGTFTATGLSVGTHTFSVRTADGDEVSPTVERTFTVTAIDDDGDGSPLPQDCADANPAIYPGAPEIAGNGIDENCDGTDTPLPVATPVTPAAPAPTPAPVAQPEPELSFTLNYFMRATRRDTRFSTLSP